MDHGPEANPDALTRLDLTPKPGLVQAPKIHPLSKGAMVYLPDLDPEADTAEHEIVLLRMLLGDMALHFRHGLLEVLQDIETQGAHPPEMLAAIRPSLFYEIDRFLEVCPSSKLRNIAARFRGQFERIFEAFQSSERPLEDEGAFEVLSEMVEILDPDQVFLEGSVQAIGQGGFGVVYRGRLKHTGQEVAIKLLRENDKRSLMRAKEEGMSLMQAGHITGVLEAYLMFRARSDIAGIPNSAGHIVLLTELIQGPTLREIMPPDVEPPFPVQQDLLRFLSDVAETMAEVHQQGLLHRDLKPSNIMIEENGSIRVIDFGLVKRQGSEAYSIETVLQSETPLGSQSGSFESFHVNKPGEKPHAFETRENTRGMLGTMYYMSPEHLQGQCREGSDVWSLFMMLIESLNGYPAWEGLSREQVIRQLASHGTGQGRLIDTLRKNLERQGKVLAEHPLLEGLLRHALHPDPERRPSMAEAAQLIRIYRVVREPESADRFKLMDEYLQWRLQQLKSQETRTQLVLDDPQRETLVRKVFICRTLEAADVLLKESSLSMIRGLLHNADHLLAVSDGKPPSLSGHQKRSLSLA